METTTAIKAPQRLADYAPYSAAIDRLGQLQASFAETEQKIQELKAAERTTASLDDLAGELIKDGDFDLNAAIARPNNKAELERLELNRQVLHRSIEKQMGEVTNQRAQASRAICEARRGEYESIMHNCALALIAAGRAFEEQRKFFHELGELDVSFASTLPPMPYRDVDARDSCGALAYWLVDAVEKGIIKRSEIPWRQAWQ